MDKLMQKAMEKHKIVRYKETFIEVMTTYKSLLEAETEQLRKHDVSSRLSLEELIWQKQNPDEPFNADDFYDWAAENARQALDFAFDIHRTLKINGC